MIDNGQLAQDTINVALNMAGYDIGAMNQFEKAHALMDMAVELKSYKAMHTAGLRLIGTSLTGGNRLSSRR